MKRKRVLFLFMLMMAVTLQARIIVPDSYTAVHSDSSWYFTFDYDTPKPGTDEGMLIVTHLCTPDTCISTAQRHIQGKRYTKRYYQKGILHIEVTLDHKAQDIVQIKIQKIY